jgi:retinol dehydrogenase-14
VAGRTVLVTGGSGGIGRATALGLAAMGAHVAITGRVRGRRPRSARPAAARSTCSSRTFPHRRRCSDWPTTADGLERTFALNHLAPFLLTDLLKRGAPARAVTVASNAQSMGRRTGVQPVQARQRAVQLRAGQEAAGHLGHRRCAGPRRGEHVLRSGGPRPCPAAVRLAHAAVHEGAGAGCCHVDPRHVRTRTRPRDGLLLRRHSRRRRSSERSHDESTAARLWQVSADVVGLTPVGR